MRINPGNSDSTLAAQAATSSTEAGASTTIELPSNTAAVSSSPRDPRLKRPRSPSLATLPPELMNRIAGKISFGDKAAAHMAVICRPLRDGLQQRVLADEICHQMTYPSHNTTALDLALHRANQELVAKRLPASLYVEIIRHAVNAIPTACQSPSEAAFVLSRLLDSIVALQRPEERSPAIDVVTQMFSNDYFRMRATVPHEATARAKIQNFYEGITELIGTFSSPVEAELKAKAAAGLYMIKSKVDRTEHWLNLFEMKSNSMLSQRPVLLQSLAYALHTLARNGLKKSATADLIDETGSLPPAVQASVLASLHRVCAQAVPVEPQRALFDKMDKLAQKLPDAEKSQVYTVFARDLGVMLVQNFPHMYEAIDRGCKQIRNAAHYQKGVTARLEALKYFSWNIQFPMSTAMANEIDHRPVEQRLPALTALSRAITGLTLGHHHFTALSACIQIIPGLPLGQRTEGYGVIRQCIRALEHALQPSLLSDLHGHIDKEPSEIAAENLILLANSVEASPVFPEAQLLYKKILRSASGLPLEHRLEVFHCVPLASNAVRSREMAGEVMSQILRYVEELPDVTRSAFEREAKTRFGRSLLHVLQILKENDQNARPAEMAVSVVNYVAAWQVQTQNFSFISKLGANAVMKNLLDAGLQGQFHLMPELLELCREFLDPPEAAHYQHLIERPVLPAAGNALSL